jgi:hypothetical protein
MQPTSIPKMSKEKEAMVDRVAYYSNQDVFDNTDKIVSPENEPVEIQLSESELLSKLKETYEKKQKLVDEKRTLTDSIKFSYDSLDEAKNQKVSTPDEKDVKMEKIRKLSSSIEKMQEYSSFLLPDMTKEIEKLTEEENVYFEQLKSLPKIKKQSVLVEAAKQQTGIRGEKTTGILGRVVNDDRTEQRGEVGMKLINPSISLVTLITATSGIAIVGISATAVTTLVVHTGGVALVGLAIFVGTTIYNSSVIDEYMKYVYSMNTTIALSFNRMRLHYTVLNELLKKHSINHRMFGQDDYPCDELTEFLETSMYFYQIFFLYLNETVFNDTFLKSQQATNKLQQSAKDKQELETAIQLNNIEYAEQGTFKGISDKIQKIVNKKMDKKKGILKRILSKASGAASFTYRALSINTIKKNLDIALNMVILSYTNLLSKYTEDYMFAISYLNQKNITIGDIDKLIFISGFGQINTINSQIEDKSTSMTEAEEDSEEEAIIEAVDSKFMEDNATAATAIPIAAASAIPIPIANATTTTTPIAATNATAKRSGFFGWLFSRGGGNKNIKQKSRLAKKRLQTYKTPHFKQLTNDISKIEKLYGNLFPVNNKSKKRNKKYKKTTKKYRHT